MTPSRRPPPTPVPPPPPPSEFAGPYDAGNGTCVYKHPVNGYGRCAPLNLNPSACPSRAERSTYLTTEQTVPQVQAIAQALGITIPPLLVGEALRAALVPLILTAEGLPVAVRAHR